MGMTALNLFDASEFPPILASTIERCAEVLWLITRKRNILVETGFSKSGKIVKVAKRLSRRLFPQNVVPLTREIPGLKCSYLRYCFLHSVPETKPIGSGLWSPGATVS